MRLKKGSPEAKAYMAKLRAMAQKRKSVRAGQDMPSRTGKPLDFSGKHVYGSRRKNPGGHRLQVVKQDPPFFNTKCFSCGKALSSARDLFYADLKGPSFKAYYCSPCKNAAQRGNPPPRYLPAGQTARRPRVDKALDKEIEAAYYRVASGVQVSIMDIPKIFADARVLLVSGRTDIDQVLVEVVRKYQTAVGGGRMLNNPPAFIVIDTVTGRVGYTKGATGMGNQALNSASIRAIELAKKTNHSQIVVLDLSRARVGDTREVPMQRALGISEEVFPDGRVVRGNPKFKAKFTASDGYTQRSASVRAHGTRSALAKAEKLAAKMPPEFSAHRSEIEVIRCNPKTCKNPGHRHSRRNPTDVVGRDFAAGFVIWHTTSQTEAHNALRILKSNHISADMEAVPADPKKFGGWVYKIHVERPTDNVTRMILEGVLNRISSESIYGQMSGQWKSLPKERPSKAARRTMRKNPLLQMVTLANPRRPRASRSVPFDVYLDGKKIDTVFAGPKSDVVSEEVRRSLIEHDGYDPRIVVRLRGSKASARQNPAAPAKPPFRHGQIITVQQALDYARRTGNASLVKQCNEAIALCKKANGPAQKVRFDLVAMGDPKKIDAVMAGVEYGETDETVYKPTKGSKKGQHLYRHDWGEGTGKRRPVPLIAATGGKALVMPLGSKQKATDWLRG